MQAHFAGGDGVEGFLKCVADVLAPEDRFPRAVKNYGLSTKNWSVLQSFENTSAEFVL